MSVASEPTPGSGCRLRGGSASSNNSAAASPNQLKGGVSGHLHQRSRPCRRCWYCCCSCSCLAVKTDEENKDSKKGANNENPDQNGKPSLEEIRSWGVSFDKLMKSPAGRNVFRDFLRCEYSEENILFWLACEELKNSSNPEEVEEKARIIYEEYISILSPKEVREGGEGGEEGGEADGESKNSGDDSSSPGTPNSDSQPEEEGRGSRPATPASPQPIPGEPIPLSVRENSSPRCPSRESRGSSIPPRCLSRDSAVSDQGPGRLVPPPEMSPMGLALGSGLPAAGGLLPPHPAAVAAYLGVVPPHRLVMTSPLPPVLTRSSVSPHVSSSSSPPTLPLAPISGVSPSPPRSSPLENAESAVLDFSTKRSTGKVEEEEGESILNLSKPPTPGAAAEGNSPLDLSCGGRKRNHDDSAASSPSPGPQPSRKSSRTSSDFKSVVSPWSSPAIASHFPYFAAAVAAATQNLSPKSNASENTLWNGKLKMPEKSPSHYANTPTDSSKALEKLNELSKLGGEDLFRSSLMTGNNIAGSAGRHSAWQSHWLNKGAEQAKDVLKCVWCKQSFPSLAAMTTHMKEAKHCGVNVPSSPLQPQTPTPPVQPAVSSPSASNGPTPSGKQDLNLLIKETMPLPRKLVRGQDVWLGKGAEQTRQILKCMWCGQSFRSLAEMTSHMQQTQHYTNIISQEQIISWKSADDKQGGGGGGPPGPGAAAGASSHVSAVLTCKVCDQAFSSLKELSNHMVKNSHYKEHIMRSISESGGRRRQTREKRKKSLPVRKLLELERAQNELKNGEAGLNSKLARDFVSGARITCEKCGDKIETSLFVEHIRQCIGAGLISNNQRNLLKNALLSENAIPGFRDGRKSADDTAAAKQHRSPSASDLPSTPVSPKDGAQEGKQSGDSPSVLNAIEKLIEKSFDSRSRHGGNFPGGITGGNAPIGSSILKRLGIDESVDYTKPLVDAQTMNILRSYHHQSNYRRERSGSESSSMSERGARSETLTPDRKSDLPLMQRSTPDKKLLSPPSVKTSNHDESNDDEPLVKKDAAADESEDAEDRIKQEVLVKKEKSEEEDGEEERNVNGQREEEDVGRSTHSPVTSPKNETGAPSPCRSSPATSERSGTPRSGTAEKKSSLGALSSMFDNLSGGTNSGEASAASGKTTSSHPLAALQKLCDKTETHPTGGGRGESGGGGGGSGASAATTQVPGTTPGAILAFSWACNDAVVTSDSIMKCAFCDTPFISKGAYRHHLSKMHFVKDGVMPDAVALKAQSASVKTAASSRTISSPNSGSSTAKSPQPSFEESPHSKFLKYTELAKQLSSKYV